MKIAKLEVEQDHLRITLNHKSAVLDIVSCLVMTAFGMAIIILIGWYVVLYSF